MHDIAVLVGKNLDLNVASSLDVPLEEHCAITKGSFSFATSFVEPRFQFSGRTDDAHAAPTAPKRGLRNERETNGFRSLLGSFGALDCFLSPRNNSDTGFLRKVACRNLIS